MLNNERHASEEESKNVNEIRTNTSKIFIVMIKQHKQSINWEEINEVAEQNIKMIVKFISHGCLYEQTNICLLKEDIVYRKMFNLIYNHTDGACCVLISLDN